MVSRYGKESFPGTEQEWFPGKEQKGFSVRNRTKDRASDRRGGEETRFDRSIVSHEDSWGACRRVLCVRMPEINVFLDPGRTSQWARSTG